MKQKTIRYFSAVIFTNGGIQLVRRTFLKIWAWVFWVRTVLPEVTKSIEKSLDFILRFCQQERRPAAGEYLQNFDCNVFWNGPIKLRIDNIHLCRCSLIVVLCMVDQYPLWGSTCTAVRLIPVRKKLHAACTEPEAGREGEKSGSGIQDSIGWGACWTYEAACVKMIEYTPARKTKNHMCGRVLV